MCRVMRLNEEIAVFNEILEQERKIATGASEIAVNQVRARQDALAKQLDLQEIQAEE